jgi:hypothetical protein
MIALRRYLVGLKMVLNGLQITKFSHVLRHPDCLMTCHDERFAVHVSCS